MRAMRSANRVPAMIDTMVRNAMGWLLIAAALAQTPALAQSGPVTPLSELNVFPIGTGDLVLCTGQASTTDPASIDMFDRSYAIVCQDAAAAVGQVYALRTRGGDPAERLAALRAQKVRCSPGETGNVDGIGAVETLNCRLSAADVGYRVYVHRSGKVVYVAEGLAGYDDALRLALRSVVADRVIAGEIAIATTGIGDPTAFARVQAGVLDSQRAFAEAYRRNNAGSFAESAEFFAVLTESGSEVAARAEALVNQALQKSNLGRFGEADLLFAQARGLTVGDPVSARRFRNYRAMHLLNQGLVPEALSELEQPLAGSEATASLAEGVIDTATAARLSAESPGAQRLAGFGGLTPQDKAHVLDGQARQLRGVILRQQGRTDEAVLALSRALDDLVAIRGGRIAATIWLRAQIFGELASIAEAGGDTVEAERRHLEAVALLDISYPGSAAYFVAKGRLAGFLGRAGRAEEAIAIYREIVSVSSGSSGSGNAIGATLAPYFALLAERAEDPTAVADMFAASQILLRPGVAQTQAVLARELSEGSSEAARLFRQSVSLTRETERARVDLARLAALPQSAGVAERSAELRADIARMSEAQVVTQARLADFARYRVVAPRSLTLSDLQSQLRPGELYYKLSVVEDALYAIVTSNDAARAFRLKLTPSELEDRVNALRATITIFEDGSLVTYPFNVALSHQLYDELFGMARAEVAAATHLIFEPDGAMLRLPPNILVMDRAGVDAYLARIAASVDNEFDFRGLAWLGRDRDVSTAVSARAFSDVRATPPSRAAGQYLGFGQNMPVLATAAPRTAGDGCNWPAVVWDQPISPAELFSARTAIAMKSSGASDIVTGAAFTDSAILGRSNLNDFRILHFATHGLVTAPRPECPNRPALVTSFGDSESDGLLTFSEIFDLSLDADLIVLSACDTAGRAGLTATREAGLTSGGDFALDGLVRAFVGAGGRLVVASHWPVPDDFDATERLVSGMFEAPVGKSVAGALREAQRSLMDAADTSHPYYWAGFAVIGDGAVPVVPASGSSQNTVSAAN